MIQSICSIKEVTIPPKFFTIEIHNKTYLCII